MLLTIVSHATIMKLARSGRITGTMWVAAVGLNPHRLLHMNAFNRFFVRKAVVGRRHPNLACGVP